MPRIYKRKTAWGQTPLSDMESAAAEVMEGRMSIREAARARHIDKTTLCRFLKKKREKGEVKTVGWASVASARRVFSTEMEEDLANHLKTLSDQFHGLGPLKCRELAFEFALKNNIPVPENWTRKESAGKPGCARHHVSVTDASCTVG